MKITLFLILCFALLLPTPSNADPFVYPHDRLAVCGDGMTADLGYSVYIEDYLLMCQPVEGLAVAQFGWSAETAQAFNARLDTDVAPFKPTVVTTCFGMNDGGYKAPDADTATTYRKAQTDMVEAFKKEGVRTIILGSPMCVDPLTYRSGAAKAITYNKTLSALADIDKNVSAKERVVYADVFGATMAAMQAAKARYGANYVFEANESQPGDQCSLVIAAAFLKALGCNGNIGILTADFKSSIATAAPGQRIVSFTDQMLTVESARYPFCFPAHPTSEALPDPFLQTVPFNQDLNRLLLVVKNLPTAQVKVIWKNESHDYSTVEIGKGINLAADFGDTPFVGPFQNVNGAVLDQQQQERISRSAQQDTYFQTALKRFVLVSHTIRIQPLAPEEKQLPGPINVIVDTDMSSDCDDAGAVALLNSFMDNGEARLIACVVNGRNSDLSSGAAVQAINAYYGHPSIPIGANHGDAWIGPTGSAYTLKVHQHFDPDFPADDKLPAGVDVYRKALASAANGTVAIASIGFLENLQDLLKSKPDAVSALSGYDLVRKKVRELVIMGNTNRNDNFVLSTWPTKILYTLDVGSYLNTGKSLSSTPQNNPVRFIYNLFGANDGHTALTNGRQSWDLTAAWLAVRGPGALWDVTSGGYRRVDPQTGKAQWINGPQSNQGYVMVKMPIPEVEKRIETELSRPPKL